MGYEKGHSPDHTTNDATTSITTRDAGRRSRTTGHLPRRPSELKPRRAEQATDETSYLGGEGHGETLEEIAPDRSTTKLTPGEAGFSRLAQDNAPGVADGFVAKYDELGSLLKPVDPPLGNFDRCIRMRAAEVTTITDLASANIDTGNTADMEYHKAQQFAKSHGEELTSAREHVQRKFNGFNVFTGIANMGMLGLMRLEALQSFFGIKDPKKMIETLVEQLGKGSMLAYRMRRKGDRSDTAVEGLQLPQSNDSVTRYMARLVQAKRELDTAYIGFQIVLMTQQQQLLHQEGAGDRKELARINAAKAFFKQVGSLVDGGMKQIAMGQKFLGNVGTDLQRYDRNQDRRKAHREPTKAIEGPAEVSGDQDLMKKGSGGGIKLGVADVMEFIGDVVFYAEVKRITDHLQQLKHMVDGLEAAKHRNELIQQSEVFKDALAAYTLAGKEAEAAMIDRRRSSLEMGRQLDRFATGDNQAKREGIAPENGGEHFAPVMVIAAQIAEVLVILPGAKNAFDSPEELAAWWEGINGVMRGETAKGDPMMPPMQPTYLQDMDHFTYTTMAKQVTNFHGHVEYIETMFASVGDALGVLLSGGSANSGEY